MRWKKNTTVALGLILVGTFAFAWMMKAPIASWYLTKTMKVPVSIRSISVWPSETVIESFKIKNPKHFSMRKALEVDKIKVDYEYDKVTGNPSEINLVELDDVYLLVQFTNPLGTQNNWTEISQGIDSKKQSGASSGKGVNIHKLIVNNLSVEVKGMVGPSKITKYDHIEMNNVGSNTGFPTELVIQGLFKQANLQQFIPDSFQGSSLLKQYFP